MKTQKIISFALAATVVAGSAISCNNAAESQLVKDAKKVLTAEEIAEVGIPTNHDMDSVSYILGVNLGQMIKLQYNIASDMKELNKTAIMNGLEDAMSLDRNSTPSDWDEILMVKTDRVGEIMNGFISKRMELETKVNQKKEEVWLEANKAKEGINVTESGLQYTILNEGEGQKITAADTVIVNYKGTFTDGKEFDANDSTEFPVNRVISGWTEGLQLLGKGGKAMFYIPSELGYGPRGNQSIPGYSTLVFEVEVLDVKVAAEAK